jgi:hypothetical protein
MKSLNVRPVFDIGVLDRLSNISCDEIKDQITNNISIEYKEIKNMLPSWKSGSILDFDFIKVIM